MKKAIRLIISGLLSAFLVLAVNALTYSLTLPKEVNGILQILFNHKELILFVLFFGIIYCTVAIYISKVISEKLDELVKKVTMQEILIYIIGLAIGLFVANTIIGGFNLSTNNIASVVLVICIYFGLGLLGLYIVHYKKNEIKGWLGKGGEKVEIATPKVLDTSVIIDGRILDIMSTGFIEGRIVIPSFVLDELRHIADSENNLKRNRGRRGLDILNEIRNNKIVPVEVMEIDYPEIAEVDSKLLKLAQDINGKVLTNDFNLNKVAKLQKIEVLNVNDLANAIKQVVLPNEEMTVQIMKEGKEADQGLAYLGDGTMIVVEGGKKQIGNTVNIIVTTVLQTSAGRMIFAKIKK